MTAPRFLDCYLAGGAGTTTREGVLQLVKGRALLGPAVFPQWKPLLHPGERTRFVRARNAWLIVPRRPRPELPA